MSETSPSPAFVSAVRAISPSPALPIYCPYLKTIEEVLEAAKLGGVGLSIACCKEEAERGVAFNISKGSVGSSDFSLEKVNLNDVKHKLTKEPLSRDCSCVACKVDEGGRLGHYRAYIHHLIRCEEMLGTILLMNHNVWQCKKLEEHSAV